MDEQLQAPAQELTQAPATQQPVLPTPKPKVSPVLIVLLLLSLVGVGGLYLGKSLYAPKTTTPSPALISVATPTPDLTASWKTYTDSQLGISIQYPPTWSVSKAKNIEGISTFWLTSNSPNKTSSTVKNLEIIIGSDKVYSTSGASGIFANTASCDEPEEKPFSVEIENEVYTTSVHGKACTGTGENIKFERYSFHFAKQDNLPYVTGTYFTTAELEEIKQILSTFKFLDGQNAITANWITYSDPDRSFEFKYDPTGRIEESTTTDTKTISYFGPFTPTQEVLNFKITLQFSGFIEPAGIAEKIIVSGLEVKRWYIKSTGGDDDSVVIIGNTGTTNFKLEYFIRGGGWETNLDQILSTFKFL